MPLLLAADFEDLPDEPIARWLEVRDLLEKRLDASEEFQSGISTQNLLEYYEVINALCEELGTGKLSQKVSAANAHEEIVLFRSEVAALATRLSLRSSRPLEHKDQIVLSDIVVEKLLEQSQTLRSIVSNSSFDQRQKDKLHSLLDEFENTVRQNTIKFRTAFKLVGALAVGLAAGTSFLAAAPEALATIQQVLGLQTEANEEKQKLLDSAIEPAIPLLPSPPKQLPAPSNSDIQSA